MILWRRRECNGRHTQGETGMHAYGVCVLKILQKFTPSQLVYHITGNF